MDLALQAIDVTKSVAQRPMKFYLPNTKKNEQEAVYRDIISVLVDQFRLPINARRIHSISYTTGKHKWHAEVGKLEEQENRYEIVAIFESKPYIVFTKTKDGGSGLTILVDKDEATNVEYFDSYDTAEKPELVEQKGA